MIRPRFLLLILCVAVACDGASTPTPTLPPPAPPVQPPPPPSDTRLDGSWRAIYWLATPAGGELVDVYELGGRLELQITSGQVTGSLIVPPDVTQGGAATADMAGIVLVAADSARFIQAEDTFVQRATWKVLEDALVLVDHEVEGAVFTVVMLRNW